MIRLDYRDARPIYEQVRDGLRSLMVTGVLAAGEKLPSVRSLATELAINPNTIQRAYSQLETEGYVYTVSGRGTFVCEVREQNRQRRAEVTARVQPLMEELRVCYLLHRLTSSEKAPSGYQVLKMATRGSARLLGREDIGQLAVGKCADLFLVDSRRLELVGGAYSPADVLATVGLRGPVDYTVVNGRVVVKEGHLVTIDEEKTAADARNACGAYLAKA